MFDAGNTERTLIENSICPYCKLSVEDFEWTNSKHTPNDKIGTCPHCKRSFMECYDITGYLLEEIA